MFLITYFILLYDLKLSRPWTIRTFSCAIQDTEALAGLPIFLFFFFLGGGGGSRGGRRGGHAPVP